MKLKQTEMSFENINPIIKTHYVMKQRPTELNEESKLVLLSQLKCH